ncbi:hypothetical protein HN903_00835 [archaeon]|jgi:hypothetical protein|nr:hypothetical protein [archaeon]MBT7128276.1 hypothetical protein [archaeon]
MKKRGWIRILEATIAVLIVSASMIVVYSQNPSSGQETEDVVYDLQREVLSDIGMDSDLRLAALRVEEETSDDYNYIVLNDFVREKISDAFGYLLRVCDLDDPDFCKMDTYFYKFTVDFDVFVEDVVVFSELGDGEGEEVYSPKKVRLFFWEGGFPEDYCMDECVEAGTVLDCSLDSLLVLERICGEFDSDECLEYSGVFVETEDCGEAGMVCDDGACVCLSSCSTSGFECGTQDICGGSVDCGSCGLGESCLEGTCVVDGCTETCSNSGFECGLQIICGGFEDCGSCIDGTCDAGVCVDTSWSELVCVEEVSVTGPMCGVGGNGMSHHCINVLGHDGYNYLGDSDYISFPGVPCDSLYYDCWEYQNEHEISCSLNPACPSGYVQLSKEDCVVGPVLEASYSNLHYESSSSRWYYDLVISESGGVGVTLSHRQRCWLYVDGCESIVYDPVAKFGTDQITANGQVSVDDRWFWTSRHPQQMIETWYGEDENGNAVEVSYSIDTD